MRDWDWHIYTIDIMYKITNENLLYSTGNSIQSSVGTKWERNPKKRGYVYIYIADSLCYTSETNTTL